MGFGVRRCVVVETSSFCSGRPIFGSAMLQPVFHRCASEVVFGASWALGSSRVVDVASEHVFHLGVSLPPTSSGQNQMRVMSIFMSPVEKVYFLQYLCFQFGP